MIFSFPPIPSGCGPVDRPAAKTVSQTFSPAWAARRSLACGWKSADFVLGKFAKSEREAVDGLLERAADAAEEWAALGIQAAMNRYN